jgi:hypothetical protein
VVRVHGTQKGLAITTDCTPRYCFADPVEGGKQAIAEAWRNLSAVGATPLAVTNCLNFANPQRPEIMGQIVGCLEGMAEACRALDFPIVSGNVSLYNESKATGGGSAILPTPAIGGVGLLKDWSKSCTIAFKGTGDIIIALGERGGHLGQSIWLREVHGREEGPPPPVDLMMERRTGAFVRSAISTGCITACHDVSDGGLAVTLAEMALASNIGAIIDQPQPFGVAGSLLRRGPGPVRRHGEGRGARRLPGRRRQGRPRRRSDRPHDRRPADLRARGRRFLRTVAHRPEGRARGLLPGADGRGRGAGLPESVRNEIDPGALQLEEFAVASQGLQGAHIFHTERAALESISPRCVR